jgi:hypothetical protein
LERSISSNSSRRFDEVIADFLGALFTLENYSHESQSDFLELILD